MCQETLVDSWQPLLQLLEPRLEQSPDLLLALPLGEVAGVLDRVVHDGEGRIRYHWVLVDYVAFPESGTLCAASDADEACWVEVDAVERLDTTDGLLDMIRRAQALAERRRP